MVAEARTVRPSACSMGILPPSPPVMAERSRFSLATLGLEIDVVEAPSIDAARVALGGRVSSERGAGERVVVSMQRGGDARGIVICVYGDARDVWIGEGRFVRVTSDRVRATGEGDDELAIVAADARRFAALSEGDGVRARRRDGTEVDGKLMEKCRYGALVAASGKVLAVSFRQIFAAFS